MNTNTNLPQQMFASILLLFEMVPVLTLALFFTVANLLMDYRFVSVVGIVITGAVFVYYIVYIIMISCNLAAVPKRPPVWELITSALRQRRSHSHRPAESDINWPHIVGKLLIAIGICILLSILLSSFFD